MASKPDNFSFAGFTNEEIYGTSFLSVRKNKRSYTLKAKDELQFNRLANIMDQSYDPPTNMLNNGLIYRCNSTSTGLPATVTLYASTLTVHVQGMGASDWLDDMVTRFHVTLQDDSQYLPISTPVQPHFPALRVQDLSMSVIMNHGNGPDLHINVPPPSFSSLQI